jgi:hypothetical protein
MIEIRCNACKRINLEVSEDATGTIKTRCKRPSCGRWIEITLPMKTSEHAAMLSAPVGSGVEKVVCS